MKQVILNSEDTKKSPLTNGLDCPIAKALKRALPGVEKIRVGTNWVEINEKRVHTKYIGWDVVRDATTRIAIKGKATIRFGVDILN